MNNKEIYTDKQIKEIEEYEKTGILPPEEKIFGQRLFKTSKRGQKTYLGTYWSDIGWGPYHRSDLHFPKKKQ